MCVFYAGPMAEPMSVLGNVPITADHSGRRGSGAAPAARIDVDGCPSWVSAYVPELPPLDSQETDLPTVPRLIARVQHTTPQTRWPAPHQMWPGGWTWPEYRLEIDDLDWAVQEIVSAIEAMRCPVRPVSDSGDWWR